MGLLISKSLFCATFIFFAALLEPDHPPNNTLGELMSFHMI